ncbi:MAG TPA: hypothetical protein VLA25_02145 [Methylotenera sp.]|nr:hypothetical protein [Methylotenera sp.]
MKEQFNPAQISKVIDQALVYQCACPAQVCKSIFELRELYEYQINCVNDNRNDQLVHNTIAAATEKAHEIMEECLKKVLEIEGWDTTNLVMPELLKKKPVKRF